MLEISLKERSGKERLFFFVALFALDLEHGNRELSDTETSD